MTCSELTEFGVRAKVATKQVETDKGQRGTRNEADEAN